MKTENDELSQRYMVLIKIDATNLLTRINARKNDYIETFSLKRDRHIFIEIFQSRYQKGTLFDFSHLPLEVIEVANDFYTQVDELYWYLMNTQDMPNTIEDEISRYIHIIENKYEIFCLYTDAELGGTKFEMVTEEKSILPADSTQEFFQAEAEVPFEADDS